MKRKESDIKRELLKYLAVRGIFAWSNPRTGIYNKKSGGFIPIGLQGVSDIIGILSSGRLLAIEVKGDKGKLSEAQSRFINRINKEGGLGIVACSIDDLLENGL